MEGLKDNFRKSPSVRVNGLPLAHLGCIIVVEMRENGKRVKYVGIGSERVRKDELNCEI